METRPLLEIAAIASALSDESRVRALWACRKGEICACQIIELLGLSASTVSKHMAILRDAGLVRGRKEGRWMYYRLPTPDEASPLVIDQLALVMGHLQRDTAAKHDTRELRRILAIDPQQLCQQQRAGVTCCTREPRR